jgi:hypothetical protein
LSPVSLWICRKLSLQAKRHPLVVHTVVRYVNRAWQVTVFTTLFHMPKFDRKSPVTACKTTSSFVLGFAFVVRVTTGLRLKM